jgi:hypothetical protein
MPNFEGNRDGKPTRGNLDFMLSGVFQRAVMAIVLMGTILAPLGTCLHRIHRADHNCCSPASESAVSARADCCTAGAAMPAMTIAAVHPAAAPMILAPAFFSAGEPSSPREFQASAIVPPQSPPAGAFNLRI